MPCSFELVGEEKHRKSESSIVFADDCPVFLTMQPLNLATVHSVKSGLQDVSGEYAMISPWESHGHYQEKAFRDCVHGPMAALALPRGGAGVSLVQSPVRRLKWRKEASKVLIAASRE